MRGWNKTMVFDDDICFCASKECPRYEECLRGSMKKEGVYTISLLREVCNQNNNYEYFIEMEKKND